MQATFILQDTDRKANYLYKARIWLDPDLQRTDSTRVLALLHEMGHVMGLHERYFDSHLDVPSRCFGNGSSQNEYTIMDGILPRATPTPPGTGEVWLHCDEPNIQGPTATDTARIDNYWKTGELRNLDWPTDPLGIGSMSHLSGKTMHGLNWIIVFASTIGSHSISLGFRCRKALLFTRGKSTTTSVSIGRRRIGLSKLSFGQPTFPLCL